MCCEGSEVIVTGDMEEDPAQPGLFSCCYDREEDADN